MPVQLCADLVRQYFQQDRDQLFMRPMPPVAPVHKAQRTGDPRAHDGPDGKSTIGDVIGKKPEGHDGKGAQAFHQLALQVDRFNLHDDIQRDAFGFGHRLQQNPGDLVLGIQNKRLSRCP